jgi:hypothetical protein
MVIKLFIPGDGFVVYGRCKKEKFYPSFLLPACEYEYLDLRKFKMASQKSLVEKIRDSGQNWMTIPMIFSIE